MEFVFVSIVLVCVAVGLMQWQVSKMIKRVEYLEAAVTVALKEIVLLKVKGQKK